MFLSMQCASHLLSYIHVHMHASVCVSYYFYKNTLLTQNFELSASPGMHSSDFNASQENDNSRVVEQEWHVQVN